MGRKRKSISTQTIIIALIGIGILYYIYMYGFNINIQNIFQQQSQQPVVPPTPINQYYLYNVQISINPISICVGQFITGVITSNIPNGICSIFYNTGTGWQLLANVNLNNNGGYSTTQQVNSIGQAKIWAVCGDNQGNYKVSNEVILTVSQCGTTTTQQIQHWYCCFAMGVYSCYQNGCTPNGIQISGPYNSLGTCQSNCQQTATTTTTIQTGISCYSSWPKPTSEADCSSRYGCPESYACYYYPDTVAVVAHCNCEPVSEHQSTTTTIQSLNCYNYCRDAGFQSGLDFASDAFTCNQYAIGACGEMGLQTYEFTTTLCCCSNCRR